MVPGTEPYLVATGYTHLPGGQWSQVPCCCFCCNSDGALTVTGSHGRMAVLFEFYFSFLVVDQGENFSLWLVCL